MQEHSAIGERILAHVDEYSEIAKVVRHHHERIDGQGYPDGRVDETASLGEASASCAEGTGDGITSGSIGWVSLKLPPGNYELVCNLKNHYANGMHEAFTVT